MGESACVIAVAGALQGQYFPMWSGWILKEGAERAVISQKREEGNSRQVHETILRKPLKGAVSRLWL